MSKSLETILEKNLFFLFLQKFFGTKGVFLQDKSEKPAFVTICNNKILWVLCREIMDLWAGMTRNNLNMVCIRDGTIGCFEKFQLSVDLV